MAVAMPFTWTEAHRRHAPEHAVWVGVPIDADELPERADLIRAALEDAGADVVDAHPHDDAALLAVHDAGLVAFLRTAWKDWQSGDMPAEAGGQADVVGYIFPTPGLLDGLEPRVPAALSARTGAWCFDTMTVVAEGTWEAARGAVDAALTAADLVADGAPAAYACRPPGHHATRTAFGGSCYLNNAAIAAQHLSMNGARRVALVDVDAHHGNGAQAIFRERDDVLTASVHVDPGAGWFPHFLGFAEESDHANLNVPLAPGSGDDTWLAGVDRLAEAARAHRSEVLVVALGVDAAAGDPNSPLAVSEAGYRDAGRRLGTLGLPSVLVQEGGYVLETIGPLVRATLEGIESAR